MALEHLAWALHTAPAASAVQRLALIMLANSSDMDGRASTSVRLLAADVCETEDAVRAALADLERRDVITPCVPGWPNCSTWLLNMPVPERPQNAPSAPARVRPEPTPKLARTVLYRHYDATGILLYVGISASPGHRFDSHASTAAWWPYAATCTLEWFPDWASAEAAEIVAITTELPLFNRAHAVPGTAEREAEYLSQRATVTA